MERLEDRAPKGVLVIDDSEDFRLLLGRLLTAAFAQVRVEQYDPVARGRPGDDFDWSRFDLLILDYELGNGENGLEWLALYRNSPEFPPVIVLTGHGDEALAVRALKSGAQDYLSKRNLDRQRLVEVVKDVCREHQDQLERAQASALDHQILNKVHFYRSLDQLQQRTREHERAVLLLIKIDRLDELQERIGLIEADHVVEHVAGLTAETLRRPLLMAKVTRIGDGTVAALVSASAKDLDEERLAREICKRVEEQAWTRTSGVGLAAAGEPVPAITLSIGGVPIGAKHQTPERLLAHADVAARIAREQAGNSWYVHAGQVTDENASDVRQSMGLRSAILESRLQSRFQALASVGDDPTGANGAMFQHRVQVIGHRGEQQSIADALGDPELDRLLDRWVLRDIVGRLLALAPERPDKLCIFLVLTEASLEDDELSAWLARLSNHVKLPYLARSVVLEVRARNLLAHPARTAQRMRRLHEEHQARFALIDVPSAVLLESALRHYPFDFVKLAHPDSNSRALKPGNEADFIAIIELARARGVATVVERVERASQLADAIRAGVDLAQGYFIQKPQEQLDETSFMESLVV